MTTGTLLAFLGIALVDSINPSALLITLQLLVRRAPLPAILTYILGVFLTYTTVMLLLTLGIGSYLEPLERLLATTPVRIVTAALGAVMLAYALFSKNPKDTPPPKPLQLSSFAVGGLLLLGVTVTIAELPTALPLLGAVGLLTAAQLPLPAWLGLVIVYNVIFVLPPLLLTFGYRWLGERGGARLEKRLQRGARETMLTVFGLVGFYLLSQSLSALGVFGDSFGIGIG